MEAWKAMELYAQIWAHLIAHGMDDREIVE
jgi:hypothetical protein